MTRAYLDCVRARRPALPLVTTARSNTNAYPARRRRRPQNVDNCFRMRLETASHCNSRSATLRGFDRQRTNERTNERINEQRLAATYATTHGPCACTHDGQLLQLLRALPPTDCALRCWVNVYLPLCATERPCQAVGRLTHPLSFRETKTFSHRK